jgi:hypothetical protein
VGAAVIHQANLGRTLYTAELRGEIAHLRAVGSSGEKMLSVPDSLILRLAREIEARRTLAELEER